MNDEHISKTTAIEELEEEIGTIDKPDARDALINMGLKIALRDIKRLPAANVQPVKRGRWFHLTDESIVYCSECNSEAYWDTDYGQQLFDYCPYCGAKMTKDGDSE